MRAIHENVLDERGGLRADGARPLEVALTGLRHVGGVGGVAATDDTARMRTDALAAMEDLDGGRGQAGVDVFVEERVGDGVVMAVELDVVVDADAGADPPVAVDEDLRREGRAERGPIQLLEELTPAGAVEAHRPGVEIREELGDAGVEGILESCRIQPVPLIHRRF